MLEVGDVRQADNKGRHTTTRRELIALPSGGLLRPRKRDRKQVDGTQHHRGRHGEHDDAERACVVGSHRVLGLVDDFRALHWDVENEATLQHLYRIAQQTGAYTDLVGVFGERNASHCGGPYRVTGIRSTLLANDAIQV